MNVTENSQHGTGRTPLLQMIFLFVMSALVLAGNAYWAWNNLSIAGPDVPFHMLASREMFYRLSDIALSSASALYEKAQEILLLLARPSSDMPSPNPRMVYFTTSLFYVVFGDTIFVAKLSNLLYMAVLLFSVYLLGKRVSSPRGGAISVLLTAMYPIIFESSRQFGLDFPLAAMVSLSVYLLLKSDYFHHRGYSLLLGGVAGLGILVKEQFIFFFLAPWAYAVYKGVSKNRAAAAAFARGPYVGLLLFIGMVIVLDGAWLWPQVTSTILWSQVVNNSIFINPHHSIPHVLSPEMPLLARMYVNIRNIACFAVGLPLFIVFALSLFLFIKNRVKDKMVYVLWLVSPLLLFSFVFWLPRLRYFLPVFPLLAVISAYGIESVKNRMLRTAVLSGVVLFAAFQYYTGTFRAFDFSRMSRFSENMWRVRLTTTPFVGMTEFAAPKQRVDPAKLDRLIGVIRQDPSRVKNMLLVPLIKSGYDAPYLIYRLRAIRELRVTEFVALDSVPRLASINYVVFQLPSLRQAPYWPPISEFESLLENVTDEFSYYLFLKKGIKDQLIREFYRSRDRFSFVTDIDTDQGYRWAVFRLYGSPAMP